MPFQKKKLTFAFVIEIDKHIEILLLHNECVIIPGFGGFTTHYVPARYDDRDNSFLPPIRTIGFNPQLRINDSLLVQSYVECYDISYPEALKRIETEVNQLKKKLNTEGECDFSDIGKITLNYDGNYEFIPCESGLLTPGLYGLSSFEFPPLSLSLQKEAGKANASPAESGAGSLVKATSIAMSQAAVTDDSDTEEVGEGRNKATNLAFHVLRNVAAACIAVVVMILVSTSLDNNKQTAMRRGGIDTRLLYQVLPQSVSTTPTDMKLSAPKPEKQTKSSKQPKPAVQEAAMPSPYFTLVLASKVSKGNASAFAERLRDKGHHDTQVIVTKNNVKVVYGHFSTENEAYRMANKMRETKDFEDCWVTCIK